jgi:hypothetical protein
VTKSQDAKTPAAQEVLPPRKKGKSGAPDADQDPELAGLLGEIESDLREEELKRIWSRYGNWIIGLCALVIVGVIGFQLYRQQQAEQRLEAASRYEQAQRELAAGKVDDALAIFADVARTRNDGYGVLAQLERAALLVKKQDIAGAVDIYKDVAANAAADPVYRDLATVLHVLHSVDREDPKALEGLLTPLMNPSNPLRASATELAALLAGKQGDYARAAQLADQLLADPGTPQSMRARAEDLAAYYKAQAPAAAAAPTPAPAKTNDAPAKP